MTTYETPVAVWCVRGHSPSAYTGYSSADVPNLRGGGHFVRICKTNASLRVLCMDDSTDCYGNSHWNCVCLYVLLSEHYIVKI